MSVRSSKPLVHGMWIGDLSRLELLTLRSFIHHGFEFHLWLYSPLTVDLPKEVIARDANEIIPAKDIFARRFEDPERQLGKGSIASPFSDIFRFKLLHEYGGWWVDMDITCLRPVDITDDYVFRRHNEMDVVGNVMKCPARSEVMYAAYVDAMASSSEETLDWLWPNKILSNHVRNYDLLRFRRENLCNMDLWNEIRVYMENDVPFRPEWYVFHWCHELWRVNGLNKNEKRRGSALDKIMDYYGV